MNRCDRARALFGAQWDDELSRAEKDWLEAHFGTCTDCRAEYDAYAQTLEHVAGLPRIDSAPDLVERVLARTRRAGAAPDVVGATVARPGTRWMPVAAAAGLVAIAVLASWPLLTRGPARQAPMVAVAPGQPASGPERVATTPGPAVATPEPAQSATARAELASVVVDSLFNHAEDVEFVLDPELLRRGRAHKPSRLAHGLQTDQAVISF